MKQNASVETKFTWNNSKDAIWEKKTKSNKENRVNNMSNDHTKMFYSSAGVRWLVIVNIASMYPHLTDKSDHGELSRLRRRELTNIYT